MVAHLRLFLDANNKLELDNLGARGSSGGTDSRAQECLFNFLEHTVGHSSHQAHALTAPETFLVTR